ncbi:MAG: type II toxin-antitoxin system RelE/ParE family toxin [Sulfuriferula sp.]
MKRVLKTQSFNRWMRKTELTDALLCAAVNEMERGLVDAHLGRCVVKKRVAMSGRGKSSGARTLLATNLKNRWFFVFGFEKSVRANISENELEALQAIASDLLALELIQIDAAVNRGTLLEICHEH